MLFQRLRRWNNIKPAMAERLVFAGTVLARKDQELAHHRFNTGPKTWMLIRLC